MTAEKQKRLEKEKIEETLRQKELEEATAHSGQYSSVYLSLTTWKDCLFRECII
jgi:hypothetical protein